MGVAAMTEMVFVDREQGPMPDDVLTAYGWPTDGRDRASSAWELDRTS